MRRSQGIVQRPMDSLTRELLEFYDDLTALHACNGFVLQALAAALASGNGVDARTTGAMFCTQWINDRSAELEQRLKKIRMNAHVATKSNKTGTV
jgi:hypothetical protein